MTCSSRRVISQCPLDELGVKYAWRKPKLRHCLGDHGLG